jgi:hypothetical protein
MPYENYVIGLHYSCGTLLGNYDKSEGRSSGQFAKGEYMGGIIIKKAMAP